MERIDLEYDDFFTQIGELNRISDLPEQIEMKVSPVYKTLFLLIVMVPGTVGSVVSFYQGHNLMGTSILLGSTILYLSIYFFSHKNLDKKYVIGKKGILVDSELFTWDKIEDLHLRRQQTNRAELLSIHFNYDGIVKSFQLDSMTKSNGEIKQILYMYQRWWIKKGNASEMKN